MTGEGVGSYAINQGDLTLGSNYTLSFVSGTLSITAKSLTISGLTGNNKMYDGGTTASATGTASLTGVISPDAVTLIGTPSYTFASASVANGITITTTGYTLGGVS